MISAVFLGSILILIDAVAQLRSRLKIKMKPLVLESILSTLDLKFKRIHKKLDEASNDFWCSIIKIMNRNYLTKRRMFVSCQDKSCFLYCCRLANFSARIYRRIIIISVPLFNIKYSVIWF